MLEDTLPAGQWMKSQYLTNSLDYCLQSFCSAWAFVQQLSRIPLDQSTAVQAIRSVYLVILLMQLPHPTQQLCLLTVGPITILSQSLSLASLPLGCTKRRVKQSKPRRLFKTS